MTKPISWETVVTKSTLTFGVLFRCKVKDGWLVSDKTYLLDVKAALGGTLFCHFSFIDVYGNHGAWGEKESLYDIDSPKWKAVKSAM